MQMFATFCLLKKLYNPLIPGRLIVPEWTWPGRGTFLSIPGLSRAIRDIWSPYPLPTAHCLPHLCVGSALHGGTFPILSPGTLLLHCYYSASYLITLFCPGGAAGPPNADCYPTAPSLLCGWSDGLEWSTGCAASDASSPLGSFSL